MMGLCTSCFSKNYLAGSPEPDSHALGQEDAQKLLRKASTVSEEPCRREEGQEEQREGLDQDSREEEVFPFTEGERRDWEEGEKLEKSDTGDSGTCVDELLGAGPGKGEEEAARTEDETEDLMQLTVSSLASLGVLEDVPEHGEDEHSEEGDEQATVRNVTFGRWILNSGWEQPASPVNPKLLH